MIERILMTADSVGGVWPYALELCRSFAPRQVQVLLAVMGPGLSRAKINAAEQIGNVQVAYQSFALEWMEHPWRDVQRAGEWLRELEAVWRPDIVHLNGYVHASCHFSAPTVVVGHSCVLSWWLAVRHEHAGIEWQRYREAVAAGLRAADLVVTPTRWMMQELEAHYGVDLRGCVIPNGRSPHCFLADNKDDFIFSAGRLWDDAKNIAALDQVAVRLSWPVVVAGPCKARVLSHAQQLGEIESNEVAGWLSRAAIYALPSRYEPFGLSALEAALSRCALVLGDIPSLREVWGDAAVYVDPHDPADLQCQLERLIENPVLRDQFGARARARALLYSPTRQATAYLEQYAWLLDSRRSVPCVS